MRLWIAYQLLRLAVFLMPRESGTVLAHVINDMMDMAKDSARRKDFDALVKEAIGQREGGRDG